MRTLSRGAVAAVVSDRPVGDTLLWRQHAAAHGQVIRELWARCPIVPLGFCQVTAGSADEVLELLRANESAIAAELSRLAGTSEMAVRLDWVGSRRPAPEVIREHDADMLLAVLKGIVIEHLFDSRAEGLQACFLIWRGAETDFERALAEVAGKLGRRRAVGWCGPRPPYRFVRLLPGRLAWPAARAGGKHGALAGQ